MQLLQKVVKRLQAEALVALGTKEVAEQAFALIPAGTDVRRVSMSWV